MVQKIYLLGLFFLLFFSPLSASSEISSFIEYHRSIDPTIDKKIQRIIDDHSQIENISLTDVILIKQLSEELGYVVASNPLLHEIQSRQWTKNVIKNQDQNTVEIHRTGSSGAINIIMEQMPYALYQTTHIVSMSCENISIIANNSNTHYYPKSFDPLSGSFTYNLAPRFENIGYGRNTYGLYCHNNEENNLIGELTVDVSKKNKDNENNTVQSAENTFINWINGYRTSHGLHPYQKSAVLDKTAAIWSNKAKNQGYIDHRRYKNAPYYDFRGIKNRFSQQGVTFRNVNNTYYTENIGRGVYGCIDEPCIINAVRTTFDFFMSEAPYNGPHFRSIVHPTFTHIGISIVLDEQKNKYFLTIHYGNL